MNEEHEVEQESMESPLMEEDQGQFEQGPTMNTRKNSTFLIIGAAIILLMIFLFQTFTGDNYMAEMEDFRKEQDEFMKASPTSPIPDSLRAAFKGLNYFPIQKKYKVVGKFIPNPKFEKTLVPRTKEGPEIYIIAGTIEFKLNDKLCILTAYQNNPDDSKSLFIPFRDQTSRKSTYGGGRYMDVRLIKGRVVLDFNKAYNPYCIYNYFKFACPIPPEQNTLPISVEAGEMDFKIESIGG